MDLLMFQSLWGMEQLPGEMGRWSLEENVRAISDAGFSGVSVEFDEAEEAKAIVEVVAGHGLRWIASCYPATVEELEWVVETVLEIGPEECDHINLQPDVRPHTVLECIPYILGWQDVAKRVDVPLYFETHRNRMTTDLLFTLQLIDAVPKIRLIADLSHFLVGREFKWPVSEENHRLITRILERSWALHVASHLASKFRSKSTSPTTDNGSTCSWTGGRRGSDSGGRELQLTTAWPSMSSLDPPHMR